MIIDPNGDAYNESGYDYPSLYDRIVEAANDNLSRAQGLRLTPPLLKNTPTDIFKYGTDYTNNGGNAPRRFTGEEPEELPSAAQVAAIQDGDIGMEIHRENALMDFLQ